MRSSAPKSSKKLLAWIPAGPNDSANDVRIIGKKQIFSVKRTWSTSSGP
jgi:hypothetical protein